MGIPSLLRRDRRQYLDHRFCSRGGSDGYGANRFHMVFKKNKHSCFPRVPGGRRRLHRLTLNEALVMDLEKYNELQSMYARLFEAGQRKVTEFNNYLSAEINLPCSVDSQFRLEYYLFGKKIRIELQCNFDDIHSKKAYLRAFSEETNDDKITNLHFLHDRWFDVDGHIERAKDFPSGYFLETVNSLQKRFSIRPLNLVPMQLKINNN